VPESAPIAGSPCTTVAAPDPEHVAQAYIATLGFEERGRAALTAAHAKLWGVAAFPTGAQAILLSAPGATRGWLRIVPGPHANTQGWGARGWIASESIVADIEALYARVQGSPFMPTGAPTIFDLTHLRSVLARSVTTRGPAGEGMFFTQVLRQPDGRVLQSGGAFVGPFFNCVLSTNDLQAAARLYCDALGMQPLVEGVLQDAGVNALLGFPPDTAFPFCTVRGCGDGNVEIHQYPEGISEPRDDAPDALPGGTAIYTLATTRYDETRRALARAGFAVLGEAAGLHGFPYLGRRAFTVRGPMGERLEIVEAGA
jgi:catechol 2,3-dioxygenase-like lactoylglutathione lyase family enzyme